MENQKQKLEIKNNMEKENKITEGEINFCTYLLIGFVSVIMILHAFGYKYEGKPKKYGDTQIELLKNNKLLQNNK